MKDPISSEALIEYIHSLMEKGKNRFLNFAVDNLKFTNDTNDVVDSDGLIPLVYREIFLSPEKTGFRYTSLLLNRIGDTA